MAISERDFLAVQTQLIELRASNYALEERCRKQQNEIAAFQQQCASLESECQKAQKAIARSKKIKDVEMLLQENENLQLKLHSQEEEFQLQNSTVMEELAAVLSTNEQLEKEIKKLKESDHYGRSAEGIVDKTCDTENEIRRLNAENSALKNHLTDLQQSCEKELNLLRKSLCDIMTDTKPRHNTADIEDAACLNAVQQSEKEDYEMVEVSDNEVSYRKSLTNAPIWELFKEIEQKTEKLERHLKQSPDLKLELETEREEKKSLQQQLEELKLTSQLQVENLRNEIIKLTEKLRKKQDSLVQLQAEKEDMYSLNVRSTEDLQRTKDNEIQQLKELAQRQQTQLNNMLQNYQEQKEQSSNIIHGMEAQVITLKKHIDSQAADKLRELEADKIVLQSHLAETKALLETEQNDSIAIKEQLSTVVAQLECHMQQIKHLEEEKGALIEVAENSQKTAEKRKNLLDEMAIRLQTKTDDHQREMANLTEKYMHQIDTLHRQLEEEKMRAEDLETYRSKVEDMETEIRSLECTRGWFERRLTEAEESLESTRRHCDNMMTRLQAENQATITQLEAEHVVTVKDLETQLEIANAQKAEHEEAIVSLKQEIKDGLEDRKIHDKKGASIIKDLKRQLLSEKKRAESLQQRLQEFMNESNQSRSDLFKTTELDKAETSSISSWSMMSGGGQSEHKDGKEDVSISLHNGSSLNVSSSIFEQENEVLLKRLTEIQDQKWILEEKLNHLEQSSAAMAEDLVRKTTIIQYYCMEGRPEHHSSTDKLTVKKLVDFIKDKGDDKVVRKMQRMLEEMLTKNMCLEKDLEMMSLQVAELSKIAAPVPSMVSDG